MNKLLISLLANPLPYRSGASVEIGHLVKIEGHGEIKTYKGASAKKVFWRRHPLPGLSPTRIWSN